MPLPCSLRWCGDRLELLDQRALPREVRYLTLTGVDGVVEAIRAMAVRGAPAIGVAGAWGMVLAAREGRDLHRVRQNLLAARPTAVNLGWALQRMACVPGASVAALEAEARAIAAEEARCCRELVRHGLALVPEGAAVLHHCHTGALATVGEGTALGVIAAAHAAGRLRHAWLDETRPRLQGAALSSWELQQLGVPCTVVVDGASGLLMRRGSVDLVLVGCDRVAANGDVANKIGTYNLALVARAHAVPFYVCAPRSSLDPSCPEGARIPIEERPPEEVTHWRGEPLAAPGTRAWNPAFDITPAELISGLITERGLIEPPLATGLAALAAEADHEQAVP